MPSSRWPTQNELNRIYVDFLYHVALFGFIFIFCLTDLLSVYNVQFSSVRENTSHEISRYSEMSLYAYSYYHKVSKCYLSGPVQQLSRCASLMVIVGANLPWIFNGHLRKKCRMRPCQDSGRPFQKLLLQCAKW